MVISVFFHTLEDLWNQKITPQEAEKQLRQLLYEDLDFVKIDHHRALRKGFPEVDFCQGKNQDQILKMKILHSISIKKIIVIYLLLCPITVLFSQNNKKEKDVISKREKEIQKYNQLLSDNKSSKNAARNFKKIKNK